LSTSHRHIAEYSLLLWVTIKRSMGIGTRQELLVKYDLNMHR
jgi:hypothetical protein